MSDGFNFKAIFCTFVPSGSPPEKAAPVAKAWLHGYIWKPYQNVSSLPTSIHKRVHNPLGDTGCVHSISWQHGCPLIPPRPEPVENEDAFPKFFLVWAEDPTDVEEVVGRLENTFVDCPADFRGGYLRKVKTWPARKAFLYCTDRPTCTLQRKRTRDVNVLHASGINTRLMKLLKNPGLLELWGSHVLYEAAGCGGGLIKRCYRVIRNQRPRKRNYRILHSPINTVIWPANISFKRSSIVS